MSRINLQQQHGQYKRSIGYWIGRKGKRTERVWWLGGDYSTAEKVATALVAQWAKIKTPNKSGIKAFDRPDVWTDADVQAVCEFTGVQLDWTFGDGGTWTKLASGAPRLTAPVSELMDYLDMAHANGYALTKAAPTAGTVKLFDALNAYAKSNADDATLSSKYRQRAGETITAAKHYLAEIDLGEIDLQALDRAALERLTNHVKGRPASRKTGNPIKVNTVKTLLQHWRQAIEWIDSQSDSDRFGKWQAPRKWEKLFDLELNAIRSKVERDAAADGPDQMTLYEFKKLYQAAAHDSHRIILLMGLFTAQGQTELAVSRRDEIDLDTSTYTHRRNKTGQPGTYWLPPQLVTMIANYWKENGEDAEGLAFRTRQGRPLVDDRANSDSVRQMFDDLRVVAGTRKEITFYSLRRLFGHRALQAGGPALRDAALSHTGKSVGDKHYSNWRDFNAVEQLGRTIHRELVQARVFGNDRL